MGKVTLDMATFKALASDTRLDILKALDGKRMALKDISKVTNLNKATLHEHLSKLNEAGLVKKNERDGHKWVFYKLTWKGECLLHPENTRIVVLFSISFLTLFVGIVQLISYMKGIVVGKVVTIAGTKNLYYSRGFSDVTDQSDYMIKETLSNNVDLPNSINRQSLAPGDIVLETTSNGVEKGGAFLAEESDGAMESFTQFGFTGNSDVASTQILTWHNPTIQWIAIVCIVMFGILLTIGIWRLWKNKKTKM